MALCVKLFWAENQRNASLSGKKAGSVENGINVIEIGGNDSLLQKDFKILCFRVNHRFKLLNSLLQLDKILLFKKYISTWPKSLQLGYILIKVIL